MNIHAAIVAAMHDIAQTGIAKMSRNRDQNYDFRGIEAAMNAMAPILIRHGITISASYSDLTVTERQSKSGGWLRFVTLKGAFRFTAEDGSFVVNEAFGEGMDSSDKATTKAQSVAFRTALFQSFVVPTMAIDPETGAAVPTRQDEIEDMAMECVERFEAGNDWAAFEIYATLKDNEEKLALWSLLKPHSKLRATIKRLGEAEKAGERNQQEA